LGPNHFSRTAAKPSAGRPSAIGWENSLAVRGLHDPEHTFEFGLQRVLDGIAHS